MNKNLSFEKNGSVWLGHLVGSENEIELAHNSLYNNCGTNTKELDYITPYHATFWTTPMMMQKYFVSRNLSLLLNATPNAFKKIKGGALAKARELGAKEFSEINFEEPRNFSAEVPEYEFSHKKKLDKGEDFKDYLLAIANKDSR